MGLIALGGAILFVLPFFFFGWLIFLLVKGFTSSPTVRWVLFVPIFVLVVIGAWYIMNKDRLNDQARMNLVSKDCGWKEYKKVSVLDGIYFEPLAGNPEGTGDNYYLSIYPAVEFPGYKGKVYRELRDSLQPRSRVEIERRTFRYGVRIKEEHADRDILRIKDTILDFDTGEILAENISYTFETTERHSVDLKDILFFFVLYHPSGCGWVGSLEQEKRIRSVLQPKEGFK